MANFKGYEPIPAGLDEIGSSTALQSECVDMARRGANWANSIDPEGKYVATPQSVPAGWFNRSRVGAVVEATGNPDASTRALTRSVSIMEGS